MTVAVHVVRCQWWYSSIAPAPTPIPQNKVTYLLAALAALLGVLAICLLYLLDEALIQREGLVTQQWCRLEPAVVHLSTLLAVLLNLILLALLSLLALLTLLTLFTLFTLLVLILSY